MKTRTQLEKELKAKYNGWNPQLWTAEEAAELAAIKAANRAVTGGAVSVDLTPPAVQQPIAPEAKCEALELFTARTKKGFPKLNCRVGFFWVGYDNSLFYSEPQNDVCEFHGTIGKPGLQTRAEVAAFVSDFQN
jgi:hypothetical protein